MKQFFIILICLVATTITNATEKDSVTALARKTFEKEFPGAIYQSWEKVSDEGIYSVRYVYNEQAFLAFIDEEGTMLASLREIDKKNLPMIANKAIARKYKGFDISKVDEMTTVVETSYLVSIENGGSRVYLRVYSNGSTYELKKTKQRKKG